jgi:hypothetical protein
MFKKVFKIATAVIVSFLVEESSSMISRDQYLSTEEYLPNCRKFSELFPAKILLKPIGSVSEII